MKGSDVSEIDRLLDGLPKGWEREDDEHLVGPSSCRFRTKVLAARQPDSEQWLCHLDVTPKKGKVPAKFICAFSTPAEPAFLGALGALGDFDGEVDEIPEIFTSRGLRITWRRGSTSERFAPSD